MIENTEGRKRDLGISSRRRFLTIMLTAGAATMLASVLPSILTNNSSESTTVESTTSNSTVTTTVNRTNTPITNQSAMNITVPTSSHISAIKSFPTNKTQSIATSTNVTSVASKATNGATAQTNVKLTPLYDWYVVQIGPTSHLSTSNYMLVVDGLVENQLTITYDELIKMPTKTIIGVIECVSDPFFLNATVEWTGVPLKYILNMAGIKSSATKVILYGADGYTSDLPLWKAMEDDTLVAFMADGQPLLASHGYPVRLYVPRWWGYKSVKWLVKITVTDENYLGYWESRGYPDIARVNGE